jgi:hypothetical protein
MTAETAGTTVGRDVNLEEHRGQESEELPLGGYAVLATVFATGLTALLATLTTERRLPNEISIRDLLQTGIATNRIARVITRDRVTMPLRRPFAEYTGRAGPNEVSERPRGRGLRRAIGSLITCPFCAAPWIAAASLGALLFRPRITRFVQAIFVCVTVSDFVQQLYSASRTLDGARPSGRMPRAKPRRGAHAR